MLGLDLAIGIKTAWKRKKLAQSPPNRLNVFGDSITAGTGASVENNRWATKLAFSKGLTLVNNGISGTVLQGSVSLTGSALANNGKSRYLTDLLSGINISSNYVIAYGLNDLRYNQSVTAPSQLSVTNFITDYREIINRLISEGVSPVNICLVTPYWIPDAGYSAGTTGFTGSTRTVHENYVAQVIALGQELGCTVRDVYSAMKNHANPASLIGADNIHPNDTGHDFIFQTLANIPTAAGKAPAVDATFSLSTPVITNLVSNIWTSTDGLSAFNGIAQVTGSFTVGVEEAWIEAAYDNITDAGLVLTFGTTSGLPATSGNTHLVLMAPNGVLFKAANGASSTTTSYTIPSAGADVRVRLKCGVDGVVVIQTTTDSITWTTRYTFGGNASGTYYTRMYTSGVRKTYRPKIYGIS